MSGKCSIQCPACGAELVAAINTSLELMLPEAIADVADSTAATPTPESGTTSQKRLDTIPAVSPAEPWAQPMAEPLARVDFLTDLEKRLDSIAAEYWAARVPLEAEGRPPAVPWEEPLARVNFFTDLEKRIGTAAVAETSVAPDCDGSGSSGSGNTKLSPSPPQMPPPGRQKLMPSQPQLPPLGREKAVGGPRPPSAPPSQEVLMRSLVTTPKFGRGASKHPPAKRPRDKK